jgi:hypothetical protein
MAAKHYAVVAGVAFVMTLTTIIGVFWLLSYGLDLPFIGYLGAGAGVVSIVAFINALSSWRQEKKKRA